MRKKFISIITITIITINFLIAWDGPTIKKDSKLKYLMHTGFTFEAILTTAIFSFNTITPVIAEVEEDVIFQDQVMIPKGTKVIGTCQIEKSIDRVNIVFRVMVFPKGDEILFNGIALHIDGSGGVPGKVDNKKKQGVLPAKVLFTSAGALAGSMTSDVVGVEMIKELSQTANEQIAEKVKFSISVKKGTAINVFVVDRIEY